MQTPRPPALPEVENRGAKITVASANNGQGVVVTVQGEIITGDSKKFQSAVRIARENYSNATGAMIVFDSPGGSISEALIFSEAIKAGGIPVVIPSDATCASACFMIFAAAQTKWISRRARIGVHSAAEASSTIETDRAKAATVEMARLSRALGVPNIIIGRMVTTPPGRMAWLTPSELTLMGARTFPDNVDFRISN